MSGIYLHIPFCLHKCSYCDFVSFPGKLPFAESYMACLYKEIEMRAKQLHGYTFDTVYFGGGTPSVIDPELIYGAMKKITSVFTLSKNPEITIEINPGTVSEKKIELYKKAGINRFSVGLQTAIDSQLEELGRIHTAREYAYCASLLKGTNFSADIMLGIKGQTQSDVEKSIRLAALSGASHISMYALTPEDGTPIYTDYLNGELPGADEVARLYLFGRRLLKELGFERYEISNFAKRGFESRHNLNYWRRGEYIGLGVSASSFIREKRFTNTFDLDEYMKCVISGFPAVITCEEVSEKDAKFEFIMLSLRTTRGFSEKDYEKRFKSSFREDFKDALEKSKKYLSLSGERVRIKSGYLYVQNQILMNFLE